MSVLPLPFSGYSTEGLGHSKWPEKIFTLLVTVAALSVALLIDVWGPSKTRSVTPRKKEIASW